jgi:hypothetical protein
VKDKVDLNLYIVDIDIRLAYTHNVPLSQT